MQRSNSYILTFVFVLTVVCGTLLSLAYEALKDKQAANVAFEKRKFILTTFMGPEAVGALTNEAVNAKYDEMVKPVVINAGGEETADVADNINVAKQYKVDSADRLLPLYLIKGAEGYEYFVMPVFGKGLWDDVWGYVALEKDMNTIKGVVFDHKGETPGLGARITTPEIQSRYVGKQIKDEAGNVVSVTMNKGENGGGDKSIAAFQDKPHNVDGMSGATLTGNGLNTMMDTYLKAYNNYFKKLNSATALN
ncbi:MAG: NADH:ubiquinone reductase (Na(+)-transporting) subunit C [Bacteroidetes bacterium]|nr:MAG: NADH:ubiquinone reductase (Na(+)-transporting) subunit C [Bacteroidota bacterium]